MWGGEGGREGGREGGKMKREEEEGRRRGGERGKSCYYQVNCSWALILCFNFRMATVILVGLLGGASHKMSRITVYPVLFIILALPAKFLKSLEKNTTYTI